MSQMYVYKFTFPDGNYYFGSTGNVKERFNQHRRSGKNGHCIVSQKIREFGWENIVKEVLWSGKTFLEAQSVEFSLIEMFRSKCYNTAGGIPGNNAGNIYEIVNSPIRIHASVFKDLLLKYDSDKTYDVRPALNDMDVSLGVFLFVYDDFKNEKRRGKVISLLES